MDLLRVIADVHWQAHVGDPTFIGWFTVLLYVLASGACGVCAWQVERIFADGQARQHRLVWGGMAAGCAALGLNKQLDLQTYFTRVVKAIAHHEGLYEAGRRGQVYFIAGLGLVGLVVVLALAWSVRHVWRHYLLLLLGVVFVIRFVVVRAAGFYGVSLPRLSQYTGGFQVNGMLEVLGALAIGVAAVVNLRRSGLLGRLTT